MVTMTDVYISQVENLKRKIQRHRDPQAEGYMMMDKNEAAASQQH